MLLHLFSDANYNLLGFNATYTFSLCPGACGGHGRCDPSTLKCQCHQGWGGPTCTTPLCSQACSANGQCDRVRILDSAVYFLLHCSSIGWSATTVLFLCFFLRKGSAVFAILASWVRTAILVCTMTTELGIGGMSAREIPTCHPEQDLPAFTCHPQEPCTYLGVQLPLFSIFF